MKGGRCLITYFPCNDESLRLIATGHSMLAFKYVFGEYRSVSSVVPEQTIAYDETWIRDLYKKLRLEILRLDYGSWCRPEKRLCYQDLVFVVKE